MKHLVPDVAVNADWTPSRWRMAAAWATHLFTATGAVWGFLALLAVTRGQYVQAFLWMGVALFCGWLRRYIGATGAHSRDAAEL